MPTKERISERITYRTPDFVVPGGGATQGSTGSIDLRQVTVSEGNPWHQLKKSGYAGRDIGGAFSTRKYYWKPGLDNRLHTVQVYGDYIGGPYYRNGTIQAVIPDYAALFNAVSYHTDSEMDSWGTTAVSKVIPTKSELDLVVSGVELAREGLPSLIGKGLLKSQLKDYRKFGDELLNYEFGIKPLIGDIRGIAKSIVIAEERIKQLERDSGRLVRRKFRFPDREESFSTYKTGSAAIPNGWSYTYAWANMPACSLSIINTYKTERWFSGAFTYHLDIGARHRDQMTAAADNARLLLGVKLDAEVLWNLAPWSWLADWFGNVGDIMTNVSHFSRDGLVMPYGYMMAQSSADVVASARYYWKDPTAPERVIDKFGFIRKQRRPANPFGFGLSDLVLDSRQTSILAALGITRVPRK